MRQPLRIAFAFLASLALGALVRTALAGDEGGSSLRPERIDLSDLEALPAATGATVFVLSDPAVQEKGCAEGGEPEKIVTFSDPPFPGHALSPDVAMDVLRRLVPGFNTEPGWSVRAAGSALQIRATEAGVKRAVEAMAYLRTALAPRVNATAVLLARDGGAAPRTVAIGGASLAARRWTPIYFHRTVKRFTIDYNVEVAQEAESNDPVVASLPEGAELYLRYDPGESVSLVEAWSGSVDHLEARTLDLSGIRNVPESNTMGRVEQPRTAVRRAHTAVVVPSKTASTVEFAWDGPGGARTLRLTLSAVPAVPPDREAGRHPLAILRAAALNAGLEQEMRVAGFDSWLEGLRDAAGSAAEELTTETYGEAFVACEGPPAVLAAARESLVRGEASLVGANVELRAVAVPESALREAIESGRTGIGSVLTAEQEAAFVESGGVPVASVRVPVVSRLAAEVSCGVSETFLGGFDVEIAQSSGALDPIVYSRFAGLAGTVRYSANEGGGATVRFTGALSWVKADASTIDLPFRPPVGVGFNNRDSGRPEDPTVRRVSLPIGGHGEAKTQAEATLPPDAVKAGRPAILAILSRGGGDGLPDTVLLLVTVRR